MIRVENLTQTYSSGKGIFNLNFTIEEGEVFGYLGPNGAGKTTTIRNLMGFANASEGKASINGIDCRKETAKLQNDIGYLPGEIAFFDNLTGLQFLKFIGDMRKSRNNARRDELIDRFQLETDQRIIKMSKGMKQKLAIVAAFMHGPAVYILDEPTSGLDPLMQNVFMDLLAEEKKRGKTVMMSSHIFEEVQESCDRAAIIRDGRLAAIEDIKSLKAMKQKHFLVSLSKSSDMKKLEASSFPLQKISESEAVIEVRDNYSDFFRLLASCAVSNLDVRQQSLEDIFMKYYGKAGGDNE